jgi:hypothetical protein
MHPYRESPMLANQSPQSPPEELILYGLLVMIGAIPVVIAIIQRAVFGADATLGLLMVCVGVVGMFVDVWRAHNRRTV